MKTIVVSLMGMPTIKIDGSIVSFPYRKVEGMFYYLCVKKVISREEAISIFWADNDEKTAKKNLRDVIYKTKRLLGENVLLIFGNSSIQLNQECNITIDLDEIAPENIAEKYSGDFLEHFYIKNCLEFEEWAEDTRKKYRDLYIASLQKKLRYRTQDKDALSIKKYADIIIKNDLYNEENYRNVMRIYAENGNFNMAVKLYYELKKVLSEDIGEEPDEQTQDLFKNILCLRECYSAPIKEKNQYFYGRYEELYQALNIISTFSSGIGQNLIISGDAGVGKTALLKKLQSLIDEEKFIVMAHECQYSEKQLLLNVWYNILKNFSRKKSALRKSSAAFNSSTSNRKEEERNYLSQDMFTINTEIIYNTLGQISKKRKIILILDDIQWMDNASLEVLNSILTKLGRDRILFLAAYRNSYEQEVSRFLIPLLSHEEAEMIQLTPFNSSDTKNIACEILPEISNNPSLLEKIYQDTEGNALFIIELLYIIKENGYSTKLTTRATNIIRSRLMDISAGERDLLDAISLFPIGVSMQQLKSFYPMAELEIYELLGNLMNRYLIREEMTNSEIYYSFTHHQVHDYVHNQLMAGKRRMLHGKIAEFYERQCKDTFNGSLYSKLIYHFTENGNTYRSLFYRVMYAERVYSCIYEIYPNMTGSSEHENLNENMAADEANLLSLLQEIEMLENGREKADLMMRILFILGRYYNYCCDYQKGLDCIERSLRIADELKDRSYILNNYWHYIYYGIQVSNREIMKEFLDRSRELIETARPVSKSEENKLKRLEGLYLIQCQQYERAHEILQIVIDNLKCDPTSSPMDLAVCFNYVGNIFLMQKDPAQAFSCYQHAIEVCGRRRITTGLAVFHKNASEALLKMGKLEDARQYSETAIQYFDTTHAVWGHADAEINAARIELKDNQFEEALKHYQAAEQLSERLGNPELLKKVRKMSKLFGK